MLMIFFHKSRKEGSKSLASLFREIFTLENIYISLKVCFYFPTLCNCQLRNHLFVCELIGAAQEFAFLHDLFIEHKAHGTAKETETRTKINTTPNDFLLSIHRLIRRYRITAPYPSPGFIAEILQILSKYFENRKY